MDVDLGKICVAIRVRDQDSALRDANQAREFGTDLVEFRWDYCENFDGINLDSFLKFSLPAIFTYRARNEGGFDVVIEESGRQQIILDFIEKGAPWVDIEISTGPEFISQADVLAKKRGVNLIYSWHDFEKTPPLENLWQKIELIQSYGCDLTDPQRVVKIITTAQDFEDNITILKFCKKAADQGIHICTHCMGSMGIFSRIAGGLYGNAIVYASFESKTAPGQISIENLKDAREILLNICKLF